MDFKEFLELPLFGSTYKLTVGHLIIAVLTLAAAKLLIWFMGRIVLHRYFKKKQVDQGRQLALNQFLGYIIWVAAVFIILETFDVSSMVWASSAALLVGIGLGLQDTFKDLVAGIIILVEGTVEVGDVLEVEGIVARVISIGLRTSKLETRDRVSVLIPNSNLVVNKVTNWSHDDFPTRFNIKVGVAYGSDMELVRDLLIKAAETNKVVLQDPPVTVQLRDFGDSAMEMQLLFYTKEFFRIEVVKSEIRFKIDQFFRENQVLIPFPQRDVWMRTLGTEE